MKGELSVVPLSEVADETVLGLLETCLGAATVERDVDFWRWKHRANPFGPSPGLVALADGVPVAVRVFLRWRWRRGERTLDAVRAVDTATHPDWRRRGLFRRLTGELVEQCRSRGTAFVFNTPNPTSRAGYLSLGWRDVGRVPLLVRPLRPLRMLAGLLGGSGGPERAAGEPPGRPVTELLGQPRLAPFLDAWNGGPALATPRSVPYLRWRYADAPGLRYGALWSFADDGSGAVVVTRVRHRRGLRELSLSELLVSDDGPGRRRGRDLLGRIAALARAEHGAGQAAEYVAALAARGTAERRVLASAGFLAAPIGPRLTLLPLDATVPDLRRPRAWRPAIGDLELF